MRRVFNDVNDNKIYEFMKIKRFIITVEMILGTICKGGSSAIVFQQHCRSSGVCSFTHV